MIISRSIHEATNGTISFLWLSNTVYLYYILLSIHLLMDILGCFHVLAIFVNNAAVNMSIFSDDGFLRIYVQEWNCWTIW